MHAQLQLFSGHAVGDDTLAKSRMPLDDTRNYFIVAIVTVSGDAKMGCTKRCAGVDDVVLAVSATFSGRSARVKPVSHINDLSYHFCTFCEVWGVGLQCGKATANRRVLGLKTRRLAMVKLLGYLGGCRGRQCIGRGGLPTCACPCAELVALPGCI
jgi:hypothetical protein